MKCGNCKGAIGNSINICVDKNDRCEEIRADVKVGELSGKRIWGQVVNCSGKPVANALVKLLKLTMNGGKPCYTGIAHTLTDCEGFYQFDICESDCKEYYKVIVNKAATGPERVVNGAQCDKCVCEDQCDKPSQGGSCQSNCQCGNSAWGCGCKEDKCDDIDYDALIRAYVEKKMNECIDDHEERTGRGCKNHRTAPGRR